MVRDGAWKFGWAKTLDLGSWWLGSCGSGVILKYEAMLGRMSEDGMGMGMGLGRRKVFMGIGSKGEGLHAPLQHCLIIQTSIYNHDIPVSGQKSQAS